MCTLHSVLLSIWPVPYFSCSNVATVSRVSLSSAKERSGHRRTEREVLEAAARHIQEQRRDELPRLQGIRSFLSIQDERESKKSELPEVTTSGRFLVRLPPRSRIPCLLGGHLNCVVKRTVALCQQRTWRVPPREGRPRALQYD